jgi:glyoxylase-like metal-dependent hydrolase (beta-lactamase superfamily II)
MSSVPLWENAEWFDDWFAVEQLDEQTVAIGEPRYWQHPVSYLIEGEERAILFDSGSGRRDIVPVVDALAELPVTVTFSHPHFDHVGNHESFERVAMFDHPTLRSRVLDGYFTPSLGQHLKLGRPSFQVDEWWATGDVIDLGRRELEVLHVPGHSPESMGLLDRERGQLFLGDYLYNFELYVDDLGQYLDSSEALLSATEGSETLFGAHGVPRMPYGRLEQLNELLGKVRRGEVTATASISGLVPQRRVAWGDIDLRMPWLGVKGLLAPFLFGALAVIVMGVVAGVAGSWLYSILVLAGGAVLVSLMYRRM